MGSVQIRNRATLAGNQCNASPAADTAPPLLVYGAALVVVGPGGERRIPLDDFFVRSGVTTLAAGELVTAVELPIPATRGRGAPERRTRRRGHDLASVTVAVAVDDDGVARLAFGSLGPRPLLVVDESGRLATRTLRRCRRAACSGAARQAHAIADIDARRPRIPAGDAARPGARALARRSPALDGRGCLIASIALTLNGRPRSSRRAAPHPARRAARRPRPDRHQGVLPRRRVRRLHRAAQRPHRGLVPRPGGRGGRRRGDDSRGARRRPVRCRALQEASSSTARSSAASASPGS